MCQMPYIGMAVITSTVIEMQYNRPHTTERNVTPALIGSTLDFFFFHECAE